MQMINEITIMQKNKNLFNRITTSLKKNMKLILPPFPKKRVRGKLYISSGDITPSLDATVELLPDDIITVQEKDNVFFCSKLHTQLKLLPDPYCSNTDDMALDYINFYKQFLDYREYRVKKVKGLFERFQLDGITKTCDDAYIKSTDLYKELTTLFDKAKDIQVKQSLHKDVQKKLTVRENIMPLIIYSISKDEFNYTSSQLSSGRSVNATSNRRNISGASLSKLGNSEIESICQLTSYNTPYDRWSNIEGVQLSSIFRFEFYNNW